MAYVPNGKPRGRPRKPRPGDPDYVPPSDALPTDEEVSAAAKTLNARAAATADQRELRPIRRKKTLDDFAKEWDLARRKYTEAIDSGSKEVPNLRAYREMLLDEAKMYGISVAEIVDRRSDHEKLDESIDKLFSEGEKNASTLELMDAELDVLERAMERVIQLGQEVEAKAVGECASEAYLAERRRVELRARLGKAWRERIRKLRALKALAREPLPTGNLWKHKLSKSTEMGHWVGDTEIPLSERRAWEDRAEHLMRATLVLRHMAYTMRTNIPERQQRGGGSAIFDFQLHHAQAAWELYLMDNSLDWGASGAVPCEPWTGAIIVMPPGLGKTTMSVGYYSLRLGQNPYNKIMSGHAAENKATDKIRYLSSMFKDDNAAGRRMRALYGEFKHNKDNDHEFNLVLDDKSKSSTIVAHGMTSKISGSDVSIMDFDDPVDMQEREQAEERRRKLELMNGNWLSRKRGKNDKDITWTTLWHEDDANCKRIKQARDGAIRLRVLVLRHGGPEDRPAFNSLWPEEYPPSRLKSLFNADPANYSACYMSDPRIEQLRVIRKLRYYDPADETHAEFMRAAAKHLSADPAATSKSKSDKASLIYAACGEYRETDNLGRTVTETRMRVVDAKQFHATQSSLVSEIGAMCNGGLSVDCVHVEMVTGFKAIGEMLEDRFGVRAVDHQPGIRDKATRLKGIAAMLDNSIRGAVIEFPGTRDRFGRVGPDPRWQWLYDQFLRFGTVKDDHCVDALVQLAAWLQRNGELSAGSGVVTEQVQAAVIERGDPRIREWTRKVLSIGVSSRTEEEDDWASMATEAWRDN